MDDIQTIDDQAAVDYSAGYTASDVLSAANLSLSNDSTYQRSIETLAPGITAQVDAQQQGGESWADTLQRLLPTLATTYQQAQLLHIQTERAKAGLPPLDVSKYGVGVSVGLSPDTQKVLLLGALALGGLFLLSRR